MYIMEYGYKENYLTAIIINGEVFEDFSNLPEGTVYTNNSLQPLYILGKHLGFTPKVLSKNAAVRIGKTKFITLEKWRVGELTEEKLQTLFDRFSVRGELPASVGIAANSSLPSGEWKLPELSKREAILSSGEYEDEYIPAYRAGIISLTGESKKIYKNLSSWDVSSAYPAALLEGVYPIEESTSVDTDNFSISENGTIAGISGFIGLFELTLERKKGIQLSPLTLDDKTKPNFSENSVFDNIGLVSGNVKVAACLPELMAIATTYHIKEQKIKELHTHKIGKISTSISTMIQKLYKEKKENPDAKIIINTISGLSARNPIRDIRGDKTEESVSKAVDTYNGKNRRFPTTMGGFARKLDLRMAVYMNSWVRLKMIQTAIRLSEVGATVIYADTDSIKCIGDSGKISEVFENSNKVVKNKVGDSGLGQWGNESEDYTHGAVFFEKRFYVRHGDDGITPVMAGVDIETTMEFYQKAGSLEKILKNPVAVQARWMRSNIGFPERVFRVFKI